MIAESIAAAVAFLLFLQVRKKDKILSNNSTNEESQDHTASQKALC